MTQHYVKPHRGVLILVFGILAWAVCSIFGIAAWVMGNADLREMDAGVMDAEGRGLTQAGRILGMINVILLIVGIALGLLFVGLGAVSSTG